MRNIKILTKHARNGKSYEIKVCSTHELEYCRGCFYDFREINRMEEEDASNDEITSTTSTDSENHWFTTAITSLTFLVFLLPLLAFYIKQSSPLQ